MKNLALLLFAVITLVGCWVLPEPVTLVGFGILPGPGISFQMPEWQRFIKAEDTRRAETGESTVFFYRTNRTKGYFINYYINDGNKVIGALRSGGYFRYITYPGVHYFWTESEKKSYVYINCLPDEKHYVEGNISIRANMWNPKLTVVPESVAKPQLKGLQYYDYDFTRPAQMN